MHHLDKLSKFIHYVLGRCPDEFGLVTDDDGYVKVKTLLQALHEEPQWRAVRHSHLNELLLSVRPSPIEIKDNLIRAVERSNLCRAQAPLSPMPKLLFTFVRPRAHTFTATHGILPTETIPYIVATHTEAMAQRMGRRIDPHPVIIPIKVNEALAAGVAFRAYGQHLFLCDALAPEVLICPPLPKTPAVTPKNEKPQSAALAKTPGSFILQPWQQDDRGNKSDKSKQRKSADWKKDRRLARKHKKKIQGYDPG